MTIEIPRSESPRPPRARGRWWGLAFALLAAVPALHVATASGYEEQAESAWEARRRILAAVPKDPTILINVTQREMPSSPDLLQLGKRSTAALSRCLSDNVDAGLRRTCAQMLGAIGDRAALPTLQAALEDWDATVRDAAAAALARLGDPSSVDALAKALTRADEEPWVQASIVRSLGSISSPKAVPILRAELRRKPDGKRPDLRMDAFYAVWRSRHLLARATLEADLADLLRGSDDSLVLAATEAAAEVRSARLAPPLTALVDHRNAEIRNKAVYALGRIGDRAATRTLLAQVPKVRESRLLNNISFALERLDPEAFRPAIASLLKHKQAIIRLNAAFVIGDSRRVEGRPLLQGALEDPNDYVRTSAIVALGKLEGEESVKALERFTQDQNPSIREEAIYAAYEASGRKATGAIHDQLFLSNRAAVRLRAAHVLAAAGDPRVGDFLLACVESGSCAAGALAGYFVKLQRTDVGERMLLAWARGRDDLAPLVGLLKPAGAVPLAAGSVDAAFATGGEQRAPVAIRLLADLGDRSVAARLAPRATASELWLRAVVGTTLVRLGHGGAEAQLVADLDLLPQEWLPRYSGLLAGVAEPDARARLTPALAERSKKGEAPLALAASRVLLEWDPEAHFPRMFDALATGTVQERELAEDYLAQAEDARVTFLLRRALSRETRPYARDRLRLVLDRRG
ncbi:MAG: HEAT repeat domain-containing protein [Polyangiaceae bacterium]|nr:HEAT repeat domain-containing protein [Polyangiaceae bacterium]